MINPLRVLITGTNKGIGRDLVRIFLKRNPEAVIYATSRETKEVADARWQQLGGDKRVVSKYLNVS
jgi:NAD(P)-dependent dehydrogenase (short-subunit alcohol dehydrogenase family)